jgi:hypothetical protein
LRIAVRRFWKAPATCAVIVAWLEAVNRELTLESS